MPSFPHDLPTASGTTGDLARQLALLVGPAVQAPDDSLAAAEYLALGQALADGRSVTLRAIAESAPQTATDTLDTWEERLALPAQPWASTAARQARLLSRARARSGTAQRIGRAIEALTGYTVPVLEYEPDDLADDADSARLVFRFAIVLTTAQARDATFREDLDELLERVVGSLATWNVITQAGIKFDTSGAGFGASFGS